MDGEENKSYIQTNFNVRLLKPGRHISTLGIPDSIAIRIGQVVAHWGAFEDRIEMGIKFALELLGRGDPMDRGFARRKELLRDLVRGAFGQDFPAAVNEIEAACTDGANVYWKRNVVAHGQYHYVFPPAGQDEPRIIARGNHKRKPVEMELNTDNLDKLLYEIAHALGQLNVAYGLIAEYKAFPPPIKTDSLIALYKADQQRKLKEP